MLGQEAGQEAEDKGDEEKDRGNENDRGTRGLVHEGRDKDDKDNRTVDGQCDTQSLDHFVDDKAANNTDSSTQKLPGETPDSKPKGQDANVANKLEHAEYYVGPENVVRRIDIDLNVFSESVRSGLVESIVMALEALGDVLASDIGICAFLLKEVQKPVRKTRGPCEFPIRTCGASFCLICTCCVRWYDSVPRVKVIKELEPLGRVKCLPPRVGRELERQGRHGRGADPPAHGPTPRRNERHDVEAEDVVEGMRQLFVIFSHQEPVAEPGR